MSYKPSFRTPKRVLISAVLAALPLLFAASQASAGFELRVPLTSSGGNGGGATPPPPAGGYLVFDMSPGWSYGGQLRYVGYRNVCPPGGMLPGNSVTPASTPNYTVLPVGALSWEGYRYYGLNYFQEVSTTACLEATPAEAAAMPIAEGSLFSPGDGHGASNPVSYGALPFCDFASSYPCLNHSGTYDQPAIRVRANGRLILLMNSDAQAAVVYDAMGSLEWFLSNTREVTDVTATNTVLTTSRYTTATPLGGGSVHSEITYPHDVECIPVLNDAAVVDNNWVCTPLPLDLPI